MFLGSERSAGLRSVAPAHQRRDALAQGEDDDQASRSGTRWYRSAGWWRCGRADGRGQVRGARCQSQSRQRRCAGVGTAAVEVVKADLLDPALSVPRSRGRMEPSSSPTSGIPRRCRVRPRSVRRPCKPPALPGSHRNLKEWRKQSCPRHLQFPLHTYYGVSPYIAFSWPWAKARAGGISILPPMISM